MADREHPTDEVGAEGGSSGNVERLEDDASAKGSEADSTIDRIDRRDRTVVRDGTGDTGRRNP